MRPHRCTTRTIVRHHDTESLSHQAHNHVEPALTPAYRVRLQGISQLYSIPLPRTKARAACAICNLGPLTDRPLPHTCNKSQRFPALESPPRADKTKQKTLRFFRTDKILSYPSVHRPYGRVRYYTILKL